MLQRETLQAGKLPIGQIPLPARVDQTPSLRGDTSGYLVPGLWGLCSRPRVLDPVVRPAGWDIGGCFVDSDPRLEPGCSRIGRMSWFGEGGEGLAGALYTVC